MVTGEAIIMLVQMKKSCEIFSSSHRGAPCESAAGRRFAPGDLHGAMSAFGPKRTFLNFGPIRYVR